MNIGLVQLDVVKNDKQANFRNVEKCIEELFSQAIKPDVVVLPELWSTGYALENLAEVASLEGVEESVFLGDLANKYNVWFAGGSIACKTENGITNRAQLIDRQGNQQAYYDKVHLVPMFNEESFFTAGDKLLTYDIETIPFGFAVCYDLRFCELIRCLSLSGAYVIVLSAEWPQTRIEHWKVLLRARAIENQCFVIGVNAAGNADGHGGNSMVVSPDGEILTQFGLGEFSQTVPLKIEVLKSVRSAVPMYDSRRPGIYRTLTEV